MEGSLTSRSPSHLSALFEPRTVVVVGVSEDARKQGRVVLRNVINAGFDGQVYGVSRTLKEIEGVRCFAAIRELPKAVDVAFLAVPAEAAATHLRELAAAGVKIAIIGSAGFAENADEAGIARQGELNRVAEETGIRIVGPNCNGIYNANLRLSIGFNTAHSRRLRAGDIAIISHSGALFDAMVGQMDSLDAGLSLFVSAGNEADLDLLDYLEYAIEDAKTRVIALLLDSLSDGDRFRRLADHAHRNGKHIVVLHFGTSIMGAKAAVAHSSRLAGNARAYSALFEASGIPAVSSIESLVTAAVLLSAYGRVDGGLGAMSSSGAGASLLADIASKYRIPLPAFSQATQHELEQITRFSHAANPIDLGNFQGMPRQKEVAALVAADPGIGALVVLAQSFHTHHEHPLLDMIVDARRTSRKPVIVVAPGGFPDEERRQYEAGGVRVLADTETTLQGIAALMTPPNSYPEAPVGLSVLTDEPLSGSGPMSEPDSLALLARYGIDTVSTQPCNNEEQVVSAAEQLGWPVVLKGVRDGIAHKSEHGLVKVGLSDTASLRAAYQELGSGKVIVQPLIKGSLELIAGISRSPGVGLLLLAGFGGIYAEAFDDVLLWPIPVPLEHIIYKIEASTLGRIFRSSRWNDQQSCAAFVQTLNALQSFAMAMGNRLEAVDINPLILGSGRAVAVDALVVPAQT